ncbi:MAG: hypothetical protein ACTHQQ_13105, partial [Solirubrobacteraceae bacterium]
LGPTLLLGGGPTSVSCISSANCTAVGIVVGCECATYLPKPVAARWNGSSWSSEQTVELPSNGNFGLTAVSCPTRSSCFAVGYHGGNPLAERWNGSRWSIQSTPGHIGLTGISCWSKTGCIAVGRDVVSWDGSAIGDGVAEAWNGKRWSIKFDGGGGALDGVACASKDACTAVGAGSVWAHAERWDGKRWSIQRPRRPTGATSTSLSAVSCPSPTTCIAVGSYKDDTDQQHALIERWTDTPKRAGATRCRLGAHMGDWLSRR